MKLRKPRYYINRVVTKLARAAEPINPPAPPPSVPRESLELSAARWDLRNAIDEVPRDQAKINRLRRQVAMLQMKP